ncbi:unnamed protein product [Rotaria sp. Silwood1]|nr:unnamed protein product [Rotaria sp. Silwood1]
MGLISNWNKIVNSDNSIVESKLKEKQNRASVPQSLALLMNFKDDGTMSLQIIQGSEVVYLDYGLCKHGQIFDPAIGRCRDTYCQEINYKFNGTTCVPDESKNTVNVYKRMSDIDVSITLVILPKNWNESEKGNFSKRLNSQMNETCTNDWAEMFHNTLHGFSIYICEIRERLPYYALYAWGMPVIIILIGIILDAKNAQLKPCYGRYFRGCYDICFHTKHDAPLQGKLLSVTLKNMKIE